MFLRGVLPGNLKSSPLLHHRLGVRRLPHGDKNTKQDLPLDTCCAQFFWDVAGLGDPVQFSVWVVLRLVRAKPS